MVEFLDRLPSLPWIILFSPFIASLLIVFFALKSPKWASTLSVLGILTSLAGSVGLYLFHSRNTLMPAESAYDWIRIAGLRADFGFLIDPLSILMLLVVTGVGSCIFFYSIGYMKGDASYPRYFATLSFFAFSMIGIVLANNFLMLFVFWELVAVSSYLLIGFWFEKPSAADAGNKAFIVNRVADFGFVLGIFFVWMLSGTGGRERTFEFTALSHILPEAVNQGLLSQGLLTGAALLVFCGVVGKSAQFPLYIWLPDAMEGPTPVSALIHAATMVAAGVYLLSRSFFLISGSAEALQIIAHIGAVTALLAALLAVVQNDIKKILAYSTISQLGIMVMALGLGGPSAGMYHLTTHAFFKALLFLGAGAMIHALHTQDIWEMGGLLKQMRVTAITFLIGTAALCGLFPFSGFFSKDAILSLAREKNLFLYILGLVTAGLTAFYMTRAVWVAVLGPKKAKKHGGHEHESHDAPAIMKIPLIILSILSAAGGFIGLEHFMQKEAHGTPFHWDVAITSTLAALGGIALGSLIYARVKSKEDPIKAALGKFYDFLVKKYYLDELFLSIAGFFDGFTAKILFWFDKNMIIEKGVNGAAGFTSGAGSLLRRLQTGYVQTYAILFSAGIIALIYFVVLKG